MGRMFDVIIIGAGPAGCGAAYDLRAAGLSVLLLDKKTFPRLKPCAGAITVKALKALRYPVEPVIRHVCHDFRVGLRTERVDLFSSRYPIAAMTVRSDFDAYCLGQCLRLGVGFEQVSPILQITKADDEWLIVTAHGHLRTRFLIGADGANSQVRKLLNLSPPANVGFALEACVYTSRAAEYPMEVDFGIVDRGYGWIFPKGDHLNVGLFTLAPTIHDAGTKLADYCQRKAGERFDPSVQPLHGYKVPYGNRAFCHKRGGAFLVGDAAGLVDPLLGEGIYNAIRSGQLAAAAIMDVVRHGVDTYDQRIREITLDLASYDFDTRMFYSYIDRGYRHLNLWPVRYAIMRGFALGLPFRQIKRKLLLLPFLRPRHYLVDYPQGVMEHDATSNLQERSNV